MSTPTPPTATPRTLDEVERITNPDARARAADLYLDRLEERRTAALRVRDAAFRTSTTAAPVLAQLVGCSVATVKAARRTRGRR